MPCIFINVKIVLRGFACSIRGRLYSIRYRAAWLFLYLYIMERSLPPGKSKEVFPKSVRDGKRFRELAYPHLRLLYNLALKYTGKGEDAEDLVQETMYMAFKNFSQLKEEERIRGWLVKILRNIFLREAERRGRRKEVEIDDGRAYLRALEEAASGVDPEQELFKKRVAMRLHGIIAKLPEKYRAPLLLSYMEGFSYRDVSETLDMPIGTVMSSIFKAKAFIKKELLKVSAVKSESKVVRLDAVRRSEKK